MRRKEKREKIFFIDGCSSFVLIEFIEVTEKKKNFAKMVRLEIDGLNQFRSKSYMVSNKNNLDQIIDIVFFSIILVSHETDAKHLWKPNFQYFH